MSITENLELTVLCLITDGTPVSSDEGRMEWIDIDRLSGIKTADGTDALPDVINSPKLTEFQYIRGDKNEKSP